MINEANTDSEVIQHLTCHFNNKSLARIVFLYRLKKALTPTIIAEMLQISVRTAYSYWNALKILKEEVPEKKQTKDFYW